MLARRWSLPRWLAGRWLAHLGPEGALARARALVEPPALELRAAARLGGTAAAIRALATDHPDTRVEILPAPPGALRVHGGGDVLFGPSFER